MLPGAAGAAADLSAAGGRTADQRGVHLHAAGAQVTVVHHLHGHPCGADQPRPHQCLDECTACGLGTKYA